jgi:hypothetical protein
MPGWLAGSFARYRTEMRPARLAQASGVSDWAKAGHRFSAIPLEDTIRLHINEARAEANMAPLQP